MKKHKKFRDPEETKVPKNKKRLGHKKKLDFEETKKWNPRTLLKKHYEEE